MQVLNIKTLKSSSFQMNVDVTSLLNNSKKSLNNKNTQINAFAQMSNKSLRNRYAVTGL
ncbi:MAG: hypothetical protein PHX65_07495 [Sulfurimonas sp.]|nr:hypothetical protein [Sulfurimonas sp.]